MLLPRPNIPAAFDGVIDAHDIELGVYVIIPRYSNAAKGDTITLYWGASHYTLTITDRLHDFPVVLKISSDDLQTEGYCNVFYKVTDPALNSSLSNVTEVFICTGCKIPQLLPSLYIQHAEEDNFLSLKELISNDGVVLYINPDPVFRINDLISVTWQEKYSDGQPVIGSSVTKNITITEKNIGQRLSVLIPMDKAMLASNGIMAARYMLRNISGSVAFSEAVSASFDFNSEYILPPPLIKHKDNHGQVSVKDILLYQGVRVTIPESDLLLTSQKINIYWQGYTHEGHELPQTAFHAIIDHASVKDIHIPIEYIAPIINGTARVYYTLQHDTEVFISPADTALIAFSSNCGILSPDITSAIEHKLTYAQINQLGGVKLTIHREGLSAGDTLYIYSCGYDENNMYIPSLFFSAQRSLSHDDIQSGFTFLIPQLYYSNKSGYHYSILISSASQPDCGAFNYFDLVDSGEVVNNNLHASTGYYPWAQDTLQESYVEFNSGRPKAPVIMKLTGEGYFISNHTQNITVLTDRHGTARANISAESGGMNQVTVVAPEGGRYNISLTANNMNTYNTPWIERIGSTNSESDTQTFYAHIDIGSGNFLLKTSNGTILVEGQEYGDIIYNYEIVHGGSQHFNIRAIGGFTVSLCDLSGRVICSCSL